MREEEKRRTKIFWLVVCAFFVKCSVVNLEKFNKFNDCKKGKEKEKGLCN